MRREREPTFEIEPRRPRGSGGDGASGARPMAGVYRAILHYARQSSARSGGALRGVRGAASGAPFLQRCAVRVTYANNRQDGQWRAHGRYVARESAQEDGRAETPQTPSKAAGRGEDVGYDAAREGLDPAALLGRWQREGDARLFKFILSPEFGDRVDLPRLTREIMAGLGETLGQRLEWVAVNHYNTAHPHVHVALRGVDEAGAEVRLPRELIRAGLRELAQRACTAQLGYRTTADRALAESRERQLTRVTIHDRRIRAVAEERPDGSLRVMPHRASALPEAAREGMRERLQYLAALQLAQSDERGAWRVAGDFEQALTQLAAAADRQRSLARVDGLISDLTRPRQVGDWAQLARSGRGLTAGRVLAVGESESSGSGYFVLESVDGTVRYWRHTRETEAAHARGVLRTGHVVELQVGDGAQAAGRVTVRDLGEANALVRDDARLSRWAEDFQARGGVLAPGSEKGWLGELARALTAVRERSHDQGLSR